ncbi:LysE family translocator [Kushneria marisflavi]|uniref:Lysine transporter LysE n=1 Tax=Kushneria marisflavi TaxID=157779 RepID=A0A240UPG2_9GAMM|nr:LysE family translocator [Kushneria marisflavi]ART63016.1 lysine transporter LysE [Kushneria marisflavi]RKD84744.1 RhtB (resistance to homoserine/threonine) family protein [Kushneria marisflavi]
MDITYWGLFLGAALMINLTPGPDMFYLMARSASGGRREGLAAGAGLWCGAMVHVLAAALGLSAIVMASATAFTAVKLAGALYLFYLGVQAIRNAGQQFQPPAASTRRASDAWGAFRQGVLVDLLNPKTALFFMAFLPQFVRPEAGPVAAQLLLLGTLTVAVAVPIELAIILGAARLSNGLRRRQRLTKWMDQLLGTVFIGLGLRLLTVTR